MLLPGVTTLARLVAKVRDDTTKRLWGVLEGLLTIGQRYVLDQLLEVPPGSRVSDLERWRKGVPPRASGPTIIKALDQVSEILGLELADLGAEALIPPRRLGELAKYGMSADASLIRRHPNGRRPATLLGIEGGRLIKGLSADLCLFHPDRVWQVEAGKLPGKAQNTPFDGRALEGVVLGTWKAGRRVFG